MQERKARAIPPSTRGPGQPPRPPAIVIRQANKDPYLEEENDPAHPHLFPPPATQNPQTQNIQNTSSECLNRPQRQSRTRSPTREGNSKRSPHKDWPRQWVDQLGQVKQGQAIEGIIDKLGVLLVPRVRCPKLQGAKGIYQRDKSFQNPSSCPALLEDPQGLHLPSSLLPCHC